MKYISFIMILALLSAWPAKAPAQSSSNPTLANSGRFKLYRQLNYLVEQEKELQAACDPNHPKILAVQSQIKSIKGELDRRRQQQPLQPSPAGNPALASKGGFRKGGQRPASSGIKAPPLGFSFEETRSTATRTDTLPVRSSQLTNPVAGLSQAGQSTPHGKPGSYPQVSNHELPRKPVSRSRTHQEESGPYGGGLASFIGPLAGCLVGFAVNLVALYFILRRFSAHFKPDDHVRPPPEVVVMRVDVPTVREIHTVQEVRTVQEVPRKSALQPEISSTESVQAQARWEPDESASEVETTIAKQVFQQNMMLKQ